jgi:transcriptional regulator with XRE-family HTH domain
MPRYSSSLNAHEDFGLRLAKLRHAAGLTQRQLEAASGVSHRMIAYYEKRADLPPGHVLSALAEALAVSTDELVGKKAQPVAAKRSTASRRLLRRLQQLEKLPLKDKCCRARCLMGDRAGCLMGIIGPSRPRAWCDVQAL